MKDSRKKRSGKNPGESGKNVRRSCVILDAINCNENRVIIPIKLAERGRYMAEEILTARGIYSLLVSGNQKHPTFLSKTNSYTLTRFWGSFLSECISDEVIDQYFQTKERRSRALSSLMNRSSVHSMPMKLYQALEDSLDEDNLLSITIWTAAVIEQSIDPMELHTALTEYEQRLVATDIWFNQLSYFFSQLRPAHVPDGKVHTKKLFLQAALRVTFLALHALYGDRMLESTALKKLRISHVCRIDVFWKYAVNLSPRIMGADFSHVREAARQKDTMGPAPSTADPTLLAEHFRARMPDAQDMAESDPETRGWYIAANWMDVRTSINDSPMPTYEGAKQLAEITNGTVVYVLSAPGYNGLHVSKGIWGKIIWQGRPAWLPMNLMVKISFNIETTNEVT